MLPANLKLTPETLIELYPTELTMPGPRKTGVPGMTGRLTHMDLGDFDSFDSSPILKFMDDFDIGLTPSRSELPIRAFLIAAI